MKRRSSGFASCGVVGMEMMLTINRREMIIDVICSVMGVEGLSADSSGGVDVGFRCDGRCAGACGEGDGAVCGLRC